MAAIYVDVHRLLIVKLYAPKGAIFAALVSVTRLVQKKITLEPAE